MPLRAPFSLPPCSRREALGLGAASLAAVPLAGCGGPPGSGAGPDGHDDAEPDGAAADERARLDELFARLTDQSGSVAPISDAERAARRARLGELLAARGEDALVMESGATMRYLADVEWGRSERLFALVVTADGEAFWVCPAFEASRAAERIAAVGGDVVAWDEHEHPYRPLAAELARRGARRVAIEPGLRYVFAHRLGEAIGAQNVVSGAETVAALRGVKDAHELALLRRANELTQEALRALGEVLEPGPTGREIGRMITHAQRRLGLGSIWNLSLVGPDAALPHGGPGTAPLRAGDVLLIDTGGDLHGYQSDETRTWVVGAPPDPEVERIWHTVRDAQRAAFDAIRPGAVCGDVDRAARAVIDRAGFGPGYRTFTHRLGHGIGMEGHEDPYFDGGSTVRLEPGMTLSDEPGIYLPGRLGVRIEDVVCVTADGADHFGRWQEGPTAPA